jgi:hypothetical protein
VAHTALFMGGSNHAHIRDLPEFAFHRGEPRSVYTIVVCQENLHVYGLK